MDIELDPQKVDNAELDPKAILRFFAYL